MTQWIEHYSEDGVTVGESREEGRGRWFVVMDLYRYRVRLFPDPERGTFTVGLDAEWSADKPGVLANYTPSYEYGGHDDCQPGEVTISDDGLLSVMPRQSAARMVIRMGWTAELPREAVGPIRRAIALAEAAAQDKPTGGTGE